MRRKDVGVSTYPPPTSPLWTIGWFGRQRIAPGERYWWDNRNRGDQGCVCQLTLAGEMNLVTETATMRVPAGHAALFVQPSATSYGLPPDARSVYAPWWVVLQGAGLTEHWRALIALRGPVVPMSEGSPERIAFERVLALGEPRARASAETKAAAVQALVLRLWSAAGAARTGDLRPVEQAIEALLAAPTAPWSLKQIADEHGVSREHLARAFHERIGLPPAAWQAEQRVRRAIHLLLATDLPVRAVREQAGFASSHALIRRVRAATGKTPSELRAGRG
jgi:AraC-like DNA-binding protein